MPQDINDTLRAHIGWARGKAWHLSRKFPVEFDDVLSFALESVWHACDITEDRDRRMRYAASMILHRLVVNQVRMIKRQKRTANFVSVDFDLVPESSITQIILLENKRTPCTVCGTMDGVIGKGKILPQRTKGMCKKCYQRVHAKERRDKIKLIYGKTNPPKTNSNPKVSVC